MTSLFGTIESIGINPFVAGLTAIFTIIAAVASIVKWAHAILQTRNDTRDKPRRMPKPARRKVGEDSRRIPLRRKTSRPYRPLVYFLGSRISGLAILLGGIIMYDAMTAADRLRAEMGNNPPVAILYSTAFSGTLEFVFGTAVLLIAVGSALRLKRCAPSEFSRPPYNHARHKALRP